MNAGRQEQQSGETEDLAIFRAGSEELTDVVFDQPVLVQLVADSGDRSPAYGPFDRFRVTAGIAHADDSVFARHVSTDQVWLDSSNRAWIAIRLLRPKG
jgi:hypothetical protein